MAKSRNAYTTQEASKVNLALWLAAYNDFVKKQNERERKGGPVLWSVFDFPCADTTDVYIALSSWRLSFLFDAEKAEFGARHKRALKLKIREVSLYRNNTLFERNSFCLSRIPARCVYSATWYGLQGNPELTPCPKHKPLMGE
jgi:hypothetical protein